MTGEGTERAIENELPIARFFDTKSTYRLMCIGGLENIFIKIRHWQRHQMSSKRLHTVFVDFHSDFNGSHHKRHLVIFFLGGREAIKTGVLF